MKIQKSKMHPGTFTYEYLKSKGYSLFFKVMNEYVALKPNYIMEVPPVVQLTTETEIPLWKQSMDLMLKGHYKSTISHTMSYKTNELPEKQLQYSRFYVYDIVNY